MATAALILFASRRPNGWLTRWLLPLASSGLTLGVYCAIGLTDQSFFLPDRDRANVNGGGSVDS
jgi:hypothetical protein